MMRNNAVLKDAYFHHIALKVTDFDRSLKFYTEGLGLTAVALWGEGDGRAAMLDLGDGGHIEMFAGGKPCEIPEDAAGCFFHLAIGVEDTDAAFARAVSLGCPVQMEPSDCAITSNPPIPLRIAFVKGPDGEVIEFFHIR